MRKNVLPVTNTSPAKNRAATGRFFAAGGARAFLLLFFCAAAGAQSPIGLQYPFGLPDLAVTGAAAAMGGSGTAVAEEHLGTSLNPANAAIGGRSAYSAMVSFDFVTVNDDGGSSKVSGYAPKLLSLILPLGAAGNIGFAMQTRYNANINIQITDVLQDNEDAYKANTIKFQNAGGLTSWQAGWGYRFKNGLSFGVIYERSFFNEKSSSAFESVFSYEGAEPYTASKSETKTTAFSSDGVRFGTQIPINDNVAAGIAAEYIFRSDDGKFSREYEANPPETSEFSLRLPPSINVGLSYRPDERWLIAADVRSTLWERYYSGFVLADTSMLRSTYGVSLGGRFVPTANRLSAKYWEKIHYNAGVRYNTLPLTKSREYAQEYALAVGAGLPIPNDGGLIDLVFEFGSRNDTRYSNYSENTVKFMLGINGGRNWFQKGTRNY